MQLVNVMDLEFALRQYMDPDDSGVFAEEIGTYMRVLTEELAKVPHVTEVLFWDDQEGADPRLDLQLGYDKRELLGTPESHGMQYLEDGDSYYGATFYQRQFYPVGQFVISLWFGGCSLQSAPGFYVIPVA